MYSTRISSAIATAALVIVQCRAQYTIDPSSVPIATRDAWCQSQTTACPLLCLQLPDSTSNTKANDCDSESLSYNCVCGNGQSPNASEYSQTLPYFECTEYGNQCVTACNGDSTCQSACRTDHPCGAQNPTRVNTTSSSSISTSTATGTNSAGVVYSGIGGATSTASSSSIKSGSQAALALGRSYGLVVVFAGIFAGFTLFM